MYTKQERDAERQAKLDFWHPHIESWKASSLNVRQYCEKYNISKSQFKYWQYLIAPETKRATPNKRQDNLQSESFIELNSPISNLANTDHKSSNILIKLANGNSISINQNLSEELLLRILKHIG